MRPKITIKHLILDVGGVLTRPTELKIILAGAFGKIPEHKKALIRTAEDLRAHRLDLGHISTAEYLGEFNRLLGTQYSLAEYFKIRFRFIRPNLELIRFVRKLRAQGLSVSILSDNSAGNVAYYRRNFSFESTEFASLRLYSYRYSLAKPDPRFFRVLLKRLRAQPSECLFVDDNIENVLGARRLGIHSIRYISNPQIFRSLYSYLHRI